MLIATLPTLVSEADTRLSERIFAHPLVGGARYNTGGDSPLRPAEILVKLKTIADKYNKPLWVDLEGRQVRVEQWSPFERGSVTLNREFEIELPGKIFFRRAGWCEIIAADSARKKLYFEPLSSRANYFFGKGQSVHIVAKRFEPKGYLGGFDREYIAAAANLGLHKFILSFIERGSDIEEFDCAYGPHFWAGDVPTAELVLKIESAAGVEFVRALPSIGRLRLMAARDDLWLNFVDNRAKFLSAVLSIVRKDPQAIVASRLMSGLELGTELSLGDMADLALMSRFGFRHFMLSDELSRNFDIAMQQWESVVLPAIGR